MPAPARTDAISRRRVILLGGVLVALAGACADTDPGVTNEESGAVVTQPGDTQSDTTIETTTQETTADTTPETTLDTTGDTTDGDEPGRSAHRSDPADQEAPQLIDFGDEKTPQSYDNFLNAAFIDITEFWAEEYPAIYDGDEFVPVAADLRALPRAQRAPVPRVRRGDPVRERRAERVLPVLLRRGDARVGHDRRPHRLRRRDPVPRARRAGSATPRSASSPPTSTATRSRRERASSTSTCRPSTPSSRRTASPARGRRTSPAARARCSPRSVTRRSRRAWRR